MSESESLMPAVVLLGGIGLLMIALAIPLIRRRIRPNEWYGVRVAATFADESVWYDANEASGRDLLLFGVLQLAAASMILLAGGELQRRILIVDVILLPLGAIVLAVVGIRRANRLLRERRGAAA